MTRTVLKRGAARRAIVLLAALASLSALLAWRVTSAVADDPISRLPQASADDEYGSSKDHSEDGSSKDDSERGLSKDDSERGSSSSRTRDALHPEESAARTHEESREHTARREADPRPARASLGVRLDDVDGKVKVTRVYDNGAAAKAGLKAGDRIVSIDSQQVSSYEDVTQKLAQHQPQEIITLRVHRDASGERDFQVTLGATAQARAGANEDVVTGSDNSGGNVVDRAQRFGVKAERIGEKIGELAEEVGDVLRDIRRNRQGSERDRYDRFEYDQHGLNDDIRSEAPRWGAEHQSSHASNRVDADDESDAQKPAPPRYRERGEARRAERRAREAMNRLSESRRDAEQRLDETQRDAERRLTDARRDADRRMSEARRRSERRNRDLSRDDDSENRQATYRDFQSDRQMPSARQDRAALGVKLLDDENGGTEVTSLYPGGPAEDAGVRTGDVVLQVDGRRVDTREDLTTYIHRKRPGARVTLQVERNGRNREFSVTLGERNDVMNVQADPDPDSADEARGDARRFRREEGERARETLRSERLHSRADAAELRSERRKAEPNREMARQRDRYRDEPSRYEYDASDRDSGHRTDATDRHGSDRYDADRDDEDRDDADRGAALDSRRQKELSRLKDMAHDESLRTADPNAASVRRLRQRIAALEDSVDSSDSRREIRERLRDTRRSAREAQREISDEQDRSETGKYEND